MHNGLDAVQPGASAGARNYVEQESDCSDEYQDNDNGKRKRYTSVSCETCKQRKVKCDRGQPSCGWCTRNGVSCEYKERKRPGLRAGFGKELQDRMDKLEAILKSHSEIIHASIASSPQGILPTGLRTSHSSLPSDLGTPRDISTVRQSESISTPHGDAALYPQRQPTSDFSATSTPALHHDGFRSQAQMTSASPSIQLPPIQPPPVSQEHFGAPKPDVFSTTKMAEADQDMPPYDLLYALVDLYFKQINTWCPILHRKTTLQTLFGPLALQEEDRILLHAICATTMRYSTDPRLSDERRQHYYRVSKERVLLYGMENSSVKTLQALVILALDRCGSGNGPPGWNIMALISRGVVQLGLAVESDSLSVSPKHVSIYTLRVTIVPEAQDFIEAESRRRLFWMIYLLDRYATITTAFEFALPDKEIDRTLPCRDELWHQNEAVDTKWFKTRDHHGDPPATEVVKPQNLGAFAYYIEVLGILSKIHQFLKQPVDISSLSDVQQWQRRYKELDTLLESWKTELPAEFGNMGKIFQAEGSKTISCCWVMLHATFHTAVIRLNSSAGYPTTRSSIFTPSLSATRKCQGAVESIVTLGEFVVENGLLPKLGPPFAFTIWVCARVLLVHGSTVEHRVSPQISFFVDTLREMGRYWPVAARYCELLQRVLDEHADNQRRGGDGLSGSVRILADMRRTAFDLDYLLSRQAGGHRPSNAGRPAPANPAPDDFAYFDVFDFFNFPRLPTGLDPTGMSQVAALGPQNGNAGAGQGLGMINMHNITDFMIDSSTDWLHSGPDVLA
ncbi:hypothetical protein RJ55_01643 [Drechmeria coniospora]|nr:hypothetical protein RJ55_01643 [Drechmeria coniospora]